MYIASVKYAFYLISMHLYFDKKYFTKIKKKFNNLSGG